MSGKAPPKGPRALLLGTFPQGPGQSLPANPQQVQQHVPRSHNPPTGPASSTKRFNATPPTGPRSLSMNGPGGSRPGKPKGYVNGHGHSPIAATNHAGPGPSTMQHKLASMNSSVEQAKNGSHNTSAVPNVISNNNNPNTSPDPKPAPNLASNMLAPGGARAAISIPMAPSRARDSSASNTQPRPPALAPPKPPPPPPQPAEEPPPPPPPSAPPPPAPPPDAVAPPPPPPQPPGDPPNSLSLPPPPPTPVLPPPPPPPPTAEAPPPPASVNVAMEDVRPSSPPPVAGPSSSHATRSPTPEPPKLYSLPPSPAWPPPRSELPPSRSYKVIYDASLDRADKSPALGKRKEEYYGTLMDAIRANSSPAVVLDRIKGKGKGKEILHRFEGEVLEDGAWACSTKDAGSPPTDFTEADVMKFKDGIQWVREKTVVVSDPRKADSFKRRPLRLEYHEVKYEYDQNSVGPEPPTAVLVMNLPVLAANTNIRRYFGAYGHIQSFEPQIDKEKGGPLGIVWINFSSHEEARRCAEKENGKKISAAGLGMISSARPGESEDIRVVLDGQGVKLQAVLKEIRDRKRKEREGAAKKDVAAAGGKDNNNSGTPKVSTPSSARTPLPSTSRLPPHLPPRPPVAVPSSSTRVPHPLPQNPNKNASGQNDSKSSLAATKDAELSAIPMAQVRRPPPALVKARNEANKTDTWKASRLTHPLPRPPLDTKQSSSSSTPVHRRREPDRYPERKPRPYGRYRRGSPMSRSPSPDLMASRMGQKRDAHRDYEEIMEELARNGKPHVKFDSDAFQVVGMVREDDIRALFEGFDVDKILKSREGLYVTFLSSDTARRAEAVINSGARKLAHSSVTLTLRAPPPSSSRAPKTQWDEDELVDQAQRIIVKELEALLVKDVVERLVAADVRKAVTHAKARAAEERGSHSVELKVTERKGLQGLSFKKKVPKVAPEVKEVKKDAEHREDDDQQDEGPRPKKRPKKEARKSVVTEDVSSEDEVDKISTLKKRTGDEEAVLDDLPPKKKVKTAETKKKSKFQKKPDPDEPVDVVIPDDVLYQPPNVVRISGFESSLSPSRSPSPAAVPTPPPPSPTPPPDLRGVCDDDEDLYFAKLVLSGVEPSSDEEDASPQQEPVEGEEEITPPARKHLTGSARSEGFYTISHAEKASYVTQYQARNSTVPVRDSVNEAQPQQHVTSSRSNRANARRRAQGLEEINQVQRAVALSKGENAANELTFKFNQLQTRKKHLRFARSPIHDWGLYAMEKIARGEMVIEYVGEVIRAQVADKREKTYERQGIGSSYLFRIDEDLVVDATKKGNLGRLINHSCDPNCTAKIITINGEKKIVIYAKQDIDLGDEITYDYHFPFEQDKIPCLCGSAKCRGFLN